MHGGADHKTGRCAVCGAVNAVDGARLRRCDGWRGTQHCFKTYQKTAWPQHRLLCSVLGRNAHWQRGSSLQKPRRDKIARLLKKLNHDNTLGASDGIGMTLQAAFTRPLDEPDLALVPNCGEIMTLFSLAAVCKGPVRGFGGENPDVWNCQTRICRRPSSSHDPVQRARPRTSAMMKSSRGPLRGFVWQTGVSKQDALLLAPARWLFMDINPDSPTFGSMPSPAGRPASTALCAPTGHRMHQLQIRAFLCDCVNVCYDMS